MAFQQFDIANMVRCSATDPEGYPCSLAPSHSDIHQWARCEDVDAGGHRCLLPPRHPGRHEPPWYDRDAAAGDTQTISYAGTERETTNLAKRASGIAASYGWLNRSRTFVPSLPWRWPALARILGGMVEPRGRLDVEFEYRGQSQRGDPGASILGS